MALFKTYRGNRANLPSTKKDGNAYFCIDTGEFFIDYTDTSGNLQRKQLNANDAKTVNGHTVEIDVPSDAKLTDTIITVDNALSDSSENPVQNKVVNIALINKMDKSDPVGTGSFSLNRKADTTIGENSVAEGLDTTASGSYSHAEGKWSTASKNTAHAEGYQTTASGNFGSHSEGIFSTASGEYGSHAEGHQTYAVGKGSHAEGHLSQASGEYDHAEGEQTNASGGVGAHAEGNNTTASGKSSHAEGRNTTASGSYSHAEGSNLNGTEERERTVTLSDGSTVTIAGPTAEGQNSHAEGDGTYAKGYASHSEGGETNALGVRSHAEGQDTTASGSASHAEGANTTASGSTSHSEGFYTTASGFAGSHAEGYSTTASGQASHAEGKETTASGLFAHAEGVFSTASGSVSHAEGNGVIASGEASHAEGLSTIAQGDYQHVQGKYNIEDSSGTYSHIVGKGTDSARSNAHTLDWSGNAWFAGNVKVGGTGQDDSAAKTLVTQDYVNTQFANVQAVIDSKVDAVDGKGLSTNDLTATLKSNYDAAYTHSQQAHAPADAEKNVIVGIQKNGTDLTVNSSTRKVNITVPTKTSDLTNDSDFATTTDLDAKVDKVTGKGLSTNDYTTAEKNKLAAIEAGANKTIVDTALSSTSTNPVQNKVINTKFNSVQSDIDSKVPSTRTVNGKALSANITLSASDVGALPSTTQIPSIDGLATETYVDNKVAGLVDSAPSTLDTLNELAAALGDDPNFATTVATQIGEKVDKVDGKGLSSNDYTTAEKEKLAGIDEGANNYTLPVATSSALGGVKSGTDITIDSSGNVSINDDSHYHVIENVDGLQSALDGKAATEHIHSVATTSVNGFMSAEDKAKVDGLSAVTTAGDGAAYTASVPGITALNVGISFIMIPHVASTSTSPTLDVNGLGAKPIKRRLTSIVTSAQAGYTANWLAANYPFRVIYDGTNWIAEGRDKPTAADIYGTISASKIASGAVSTTYTATISTSWTGTAAPYTQDISISGMLESDKPIVDMVPDSTYATAKAQEEAWSQIYRIVTAADKITVYAHEKTTISVPIQLLAIRK